MEPQPDPIETAIARELWRWAFLPPQARSEVTAAGSELSLMLEFYLCGAFQLVDFTRSRGIWCDGVIELSIHRINRRAFVIYGVAYSPTNLAPFEMELHFSRRRDHDPLRTIIRFGELDPVGEIQWHTNEKHVATIVANRPRSDPDWAVAVELTPTET